MKVFGHFVYVFLSTAGLAHAMFYLPAMPDPMASHFGFGGAADAWASRTAFFAGTGILFVLLTVVFLLVPQFTNKLPARLINTPRKDYWLAPERRDIFNRLFVSRMIWVGNVTLLFFSLTLHQVFMANMKPEPTINEIVFWAVTGVYFVFLIVWIAALFWKLLKGVRE